MRRRIVLIMVVFILLTLTISCNQDNGKTLVREGVGRMEAIWKCMTEKEYYLMQYYFPNKSKEPGWRVLYGLFSREVCVEGHNPYYILGSDLLGYSWYLVKGHYVEDPSKKGEPYYFMEGIPYFHVDEWDVVAPVKRLHEELWESNIKGFDLDDVQKGEYLANIDQRRVSTGSDFIKMIQEKKIEGIFASAQVEDGEIQWFQLDDYYTKFYEKEAKRFKELSKNDNRLAKEIAQWKETVAERWDAISVVSAEWDFPAAGAEAGQKYDLKYVINEQGLEDAVALEKVNVLVDKDGNEKVFSVEPLNMTGHEGNNYTFEAKLSPRQFGQYKSAIRMYPKNKNLPHRMDFCYVKWLELPECNN